MLAYRLFGFAALALVAGARVAHAQAGAGVGTSGSQAESASAPVARAVGPVVLALRGDALDGARLRQLLHEELGEPVALEGAVPTRESRGVVTIAYRRAAAELTVTWDSGDRTLTRVAAAPAEGEGVLVESALLAGNLARQQVDDLLPAPPPPPQVVASPTVAAPPLEPPAPPEVRALTASLFYPLATHYGRPEVTSNLDVNLVYGRVGAVDGAQLGGVNVVQRDASAASMSGLQVGYLANLVHGEVRGLQVGGLFNHAGDGATGAQLAGVGNYTRGSLQGLQLAWGFNRAGDVAGLQLAAVNVARDVDGVQIGLINVAGRVRGASIGLINIADDIDGLPLAPFSVTDSGGVHAAAWGGSGGYGNVGVKFATRRTYTLFFGSYHRAFDVEFLGGGFALGGSVALGHGFRTDLDLMGTYLIAPALSHDPSRVKGYHEQLVQPRLRLMLAYRAARHFGAFVGVAALGQVRSELGWDRVSAQVGPEIFGGLEL